mgnify:CR=1 FL=1
MKSNDNKTKVISTGNWLITKFLMQIPILNLILLLFWSFQKDQNYNKANWAKATLIVYVLRISFLIIICSIFLSFFIELFYI